MCTVTFLPDATNGFILTHSRDEKSIRPAALPPRTLYMGGQDVTFPQDPQGKGTWVATSSTLTACLLNGGLVPHQLQPPYRHSRGLVVLDVFDYVSIDSFLRHYRFNGLEPFTLLLAEAERLVEVRWTGRRVIINGKDNRQPHIWSSVTLYSTHVIQERERWFTDWRQQTPVWSLPGIRQFHKTAGNGDPANALRMNRQSQYFTVSLTSVVHANGQSNMQYEDLSQPTLAHVTPAPQPSSYHYAAH
ncbi:MAG: NRDE family protein [Spirosoma sp.]|nr:NRDE family protein [Spirosoma sp.]